MDIVIVSPSEGDWFPVPLCRYSYDGTEPVNQNSLPQEKAILKHRLEALLL